MHGFKRTSDDIVHIVRISDTTLKKRVAEFISTPAAEVTLEEFEKKNAEVDFMEEEESCFPPAYVRVLLICR